MLLQSQNNNKKKKTTDISLGTSYELNQNLVEKYEKELSQNEIENKKIEIKNFINETNNNYYMLLCHDQRDYTIFNLQNKEDNKEIINILIDECCFNRGKIKGIDKVDGAIEIWLSIEDKSYCYYFFPYDAAVIIC